MSADLLLARQNCDTVLRILDSRIIPEIACFPKTEGGETKQLVVRLLVQVSCIEVRMGGHSEAATTIGRWYHESSFWKPVVDKCLGHLVPLISLYSILNTNYGF